MKPSNTRQHDYYHARVDSGWSIAFWSGKLWYRTSLTDNQFDEIIEKRIEQPTL